ncbi:MAG: ATP-binding protein, partial [Gammaproteobacteria bacterium]|nr:ATP-binding protein [Gammaproteobacteria bacterium]
VYLEPVWLGTGRIGKMLLYYPIDNALLYRLTMPGVRLATLHEGQVVSRSAGNPHEEGANAVETDGSHTRIIPWSGLAQDPVQLRIRATVKALFSTTEMIVGVSVIPLIDALILWLALGTWLMRSARRINALGEAVTEFTARPEPSSALDARVSQAQHGGHDEIHLVATAIQDMAQRVHRDRQVLESAKTELEQRVAARTTELSDALQFNEQLLSASTIGISAYRASGECLFANKVIADMIHATPEQVLAQNFREIPSWKTYGLLPLAEQTLMSGQSQHHEIRTVTSFGHEGWFDFTFVRFLRGGEPHLLLLVNDIDERKQAEARMTQALEQAERANKAKSEFLARMSHELRTPMNAILGFAQVLEMEKLNDEQLGFAREIESAGTHLLELINELLDLSRIETGKLATVIEKVSAPEAVRDALQITRGLMEQRNIRLLERCPVTDVQVLADPTRLKQILVNLLSNAVKYNREGGRITIGCERRNDERLRISVTDTGEGIPPEKLGSLFKPFERLGAEFGTVEGTGIGLALSKQLAELMAGTLGVDSAPGQGSTFWLELPCAASPEAVAAVPKAATGTAPVAESRTVLYVEDNPANLRVVEAMFRHQPHLQLLSATNGEYGLELARRYTPDAILLDIHLPGMDGYAVFEALKADPKTKDIPVIALSADAMPIDIERGLKAGFVHYLTKPIKIHDLLGSLQRIDPRSQAARSQSLS